MALRDASGALLSAAACLSPVGDLSNTEERARSFRDPLLHPGAIAKFNQSYAAQHDLRHPLISLSRRSTGVGTRYCRFSSLPVGKKYSVRTLSASRLVLEEPEYWFNYASTHVCGMFGSLISNSPKHNKLWKNLPNFCSHTLKARNRPANEGSCFRSAELTAIPEASKSACQLRA